VKRKRTSRAKQQTVKIVVEHAGASPISRAGVGLQNFLKKATVSTKAKL
jgi:hypothetical protein